MEEEPVITDHTEQHLSIDDTEILELLKLEQSQIKDVNIKVNTEDVLYFTKLPWYEWLYAGISFVIGAVTFYFFGEEQGLK